jgi:hypothetical protein
MKNGQPAVAPGATVSKGGFFMKQDKTHGTPQTPVQAADSSGAAK